MRARARTPSHAHAPRQSHNTHVRVLFPAEIHRGTAWNLKVILELRHWLV